MLLILWLFERDDIFGRHNLMALYAGSQARERLKGQKAERLSMFPDLFWGRLDRDPSYQ